MPRRPTRAASSRVAAALISLGFTATALRGARAQIPTSATPVESADHGTAPPRLGEGGPGLAGRFGTALTERLVRSPDVEERLRGLERAASAHTNESLSVLLKLRDAGGRADGDPRVLLAEVQGLAQWVDRPAVRAELVAIVRDPWMFLAVRGTREGVDPVDEERMRTMRVSLARAEAAMALAGSRRPDAVKSLLEVVRDSDTGRVAAAAALRAFAPEMAPDPGDKASLATFEVVSDLDDLRNVGAALDGLRSGDSDLRIASLRALTHWGDTRAVAAARAWRHDPEGRLRVAAAATLVRTGDTMAADAVAELIADDETAEDGLRLAEEIQSETVTKATAARAIASAKPSLRLGAVSALARQTTREAPHVLLVLAADPFLAGPAAAGLARSPSVFAIAAIEDLSERTPTRRLAARAYFVRRYARGDRSARLEAVIEALRQSSDGRDRAVAEQVRVGLGEAPVDEAFLDRDARVRRAAALGAMGRLDPSTARALLERLTVEPDEVTRIVLAGALASAKEASLSVSTLHQWVKAGQPNAPLAAFALGQRYDGAADSRWDELYSSRDPLIRSHFMRGLAASTAPDASARLAAAYSFEPNPETRRVIVEALGMALQERATQAWHRTLGLAASLDPDAGVRIAAGRALMGTPLVRSPAVPPEIAWLSLAAAEGASMPHDVTAMVVSKEALATPLAFDDDGFALVAGVQPGRAELQLAAPLAPYSPTGP
jgi:HEAT repeat protein